MMTKLPALDRFEYRGWLVHMEHTGRGDAIAGRADLFRDGRYQCRIVLAKQYGDWASARAALEEKARSMIDEWTSGSPTERGQARDMDPA